MDMTTLAIIGGVAVAIAFLVARSKKSKKSKKSTGVTAGDYFQPRKDTGTVRPRVAEPEPVNKVVPELTGITEVDEAPAVSDAVAEATLVQDTVTVSPTAPAPTPASIITKSPPPEFDKEARDEVMETFPVPKAGDLANGHTALSTKKIDFTGMRVIDRTGQKYGKLMKARALYKLDSMKFIASIAKNSQFTYGGLFLCDKDGNVYDWCSASEGSKYRRVTFTPEMFEGNPYLYSVSNTDAFNAQFIHR